MPKSRGRTSTKAGRRNARAAIRANIDAGRPAARAARAALAAGEPGGHRAGCSCPSPAASDAAFDAAEALRAVHDAAHRALDALRTLDQLALAGEDTTDGIERAGLDVAWAEANTVTRTLFGVPLAADDHPVSTGVLDIPAGQVT